MVYVLSGILCLSICLAEFLKLGYEISLFSCTVLYIFMLGWFVFVFINILAVLNFNCGMWDLVL